MSEITDCLECASRRTNLFLIQGIAQELEVLVQEETLQVGEMRKLIRQILELALWHQKKNGGLLFARRLEAAEAVARMVEPYQAAMRQDQRDKIEAWKKLLPRPSLPVEVPPPSGAASRKSPPAAREPSDRSDTPFRGSGQIR